MTDGTPENRNYAFTAALVRGLYESGLGNVCICPGSRSGPLARSFGRQPGIRTWVHLDERSAGYFALGMAKALGEPVAVVCTSGTATANLHPAIVEARHSFVPLLVLTADRPPELVEWGANQTISQAGMYGEHVKWSVSPPTPGATEDMLRYAGALAARAYSVASERPSGPVHLNLSFREPLAPVEVPEHFESAVFDVTTAPILHQGSQPKVAGELALDEVERGVIVCGPLDRAGFPGAVAALARSLGYPVLADPLSQLRCGDQQIGQGIGGYDLFLRDEELAERLKPELIIRFGATPTSKALGSYLEVHAGVKHVLIRDEGWPDPAHLATGVYSMDPVQFCRQVQGGAGDSAWVEEWRELGSRAKEAAEAEMGSMQELFEGRIFPDLAELLPEGSVLFAGNSMPVRDMDTFLPWSPKSIRCMGNRGASGIDGVVSTALGVSAVSGGRVTLVIGDLSFYHDMNGLLAARKWGLDVTIIVVNNDGGGVFSFLPQAKFPDGFEEYFGTPHGLGFRLAAEMYDLRYEKVESWSEFRKAVSQSQSSRGTTIIEVPGDRARNAQLHRKVVSAALESLRARVEG